MYFNLINVDIGAICAVDISEGLLNVTDLGELSMM
jgi:hypothetical protein